MPELHLSSRSILASVLIASSTMVASTGPAAAAQTGTQNTSVLLRSGHVLQNGDIVTGVGFPSMGSRGRWASICILNNFSHSGLVVDGELVLAEGDTTLAGDTVVELIDTCVSRDGTIALHYSAIDTSASSLILDRVRVGPDDILVENDLFLFPSLGVSGTISSFYGMDYEAPHLAVGLALNTPSGAVEDLFVTGTVSGPTFTPDFALLGGSPIPGSTSTTPYQRPLNDIQSLRTGGACHTGLFLDNGTFSEGLLGLGSLVAEHGQPAPAPNSVWNFDRVPRIRANNSGSLIYSGQLTLSNGTDRGAVFVDGVPIATEGGTLNGLAGDSVGDFQVANIAIDRDGRPIFALPLATPGSEVLMAGSRVMLRADAGPLATTIEGETLASLFTSVTTQNFDVTPDGRSVIVRAQLSGGDTVILLAELDLADPTTCTTEPNSTGMSGEVAAIGSRFLSVNNLQVVATQLPTNSFGYLNISATSTFVPMPGGSSGNLCIGPTVGRYVEQVQSSGLVGEIATAIDLTSIPQPTGFVASIPGDTWHCQLWHRDVAMGSPTSNFTDSLSVTVQ